jgi:hypothetical protein
LVRTSTGPFLGSVAVRAQDLVAGRESLFYQATPDHGISLFPAFYGAPAVNVVKHQEIQRLLATTRALAAIAVDH